ncbi:MAG: S-layer homology domain-containing protein [Chloroflexota bacterium]
MLWSIDAAAPTDMWAVGSYYVGGRDQSRTEHWDGTAWSVVPSPNQPSSNNTLKDVAVAGRNDVWAVGEYNPEFRAQTLIQHWDGTAWTIVPSPNQGAYDNTLHAVAVVTPNNVWAVGSYHDGTIFQTLVLHWNGAAWSIVPSPAQASNASGFTDVAALSANNVWAVGAYADRSAPNPALIEHWDGTAWSVVPSPNVPASGNILGQISAISADNIWAVGYYLSGTTSRTLVVHWDGTDWRVVPSPNVGTKDNTLIGVAAVGPNDLWAVGRYYNDSFVLRTLIMHWDGTMWSVVPSPNPTEHGNDLLAVTVAAPGDVWAVGIYSIGSGGRTLVVRYTACTSPPTPTSTPTSTPTNTPTPVPPRCPGERFTDVCPGDYFYQPVLSLNDAGIVSGYNSTPPCLTGAHVPCYLPYNNVTRGQSAKIVALSAGFTEPVSGQLFEDIPPGSTFYDYVQRLANRTIVSGYPCGGAGEPCGASNLPYFRQNSSVTRGQLSKMVSQAFGYSEVASGQTFEDVAFGSTFYQYVQRMADRGIINGYPCGGAGEPCNAPSNRPYFRPGSPVTRGQTAKILYIARSLVQPTPTPTSTSTSTTLPTATGTYTYAPTETATSTATQTVLSTSTQVPTASATGTPAVRR